MIMGMVWHEKTLWFSSLLTNTVKQRNMLLVSLSISCSLWQCCQFLWFGCYKDNNNKKTFLGVGGQGPTSPEVCDENGMSVMGTEVGITSFPWSRWLCSRDWQGSRLGHGSGVGSHPCSVAASTFWPAYFPVWVTFALSPLFILNTSVPSLLLCSLLLRPSLNLPLVSHLKTFIFFQCFTGFCLKCLVALSVKGLNKSKEYVSYTLPSPRRYLIYVKWRRRLMHFLRGSALSVQLFLEVSCSHKLCV